MVCRWGEKFARKWRPLPWLGVEWRATRFHCCRGAVQLAPNMEWLSVHCFCNWGTAVRVVCGSPVFVQNIAAREWREKRGSLEDWLRTAAAETASIKCTGRCWPWPRFRIVCRPLVLLRPPPGAADGNLWRPFVKTSRFVLISCPSLLSVYRFAQRFNCTGGTVLTSVPVPTWFLFPFPLQP